MANVLFGWFLVGVNLYFAVYGYSVLSGFVAGAVFTCAVLDTIELWASGE